MAASTHSSSLVQTPFVIRSPFLISHIDTHINKLNEFIREVICPTPSVFRWSSPSKNAISLKETYDKISAALFTKITSGEALSAEQITLYQEQVIAEAKTLFPEKPDLYTTIKQTFECYKILLKQRHFLKQLSPCIATLEDHRKKIFSIDITENKEDTHFIFSHIHLLKTEYQTEVDSFLKEEKTIVEKQKVSFTRKITTLQETINQEIKTLKEELAALHAFIEDANAKQIKIKEELHHLCEDNSLSPEAFKKELSIIEEKNNEIKFPTTKNIIRKIKEKISTFSSLETPSYMPFNKLLINVQLLEQKLIEELKKLSEQSQITSIQQCIIQAETLQAEQIHLLKTHYQSTCNEPLPSSSHSIMNAITLFLLNNIYKPLKDDITEKQTIENYLQVEKLHQVKSDFLKNFNKHDIHCILSPFSLTHGVLLEKSTEFKNTFDKISSNLQNEVKVIFQTFKSTNVDELNALLEKTREYKNHCNSIKKNQLDFAQQIKEARPREISSPTRPLLINTDFSPRETFTPAPPKALPTKTSTVFFNRLAWKSLGILSALGTLIGLGVAGILLFPLNPFLGIGAAISIISLGGYLVNRCIKQTNKIPQPLPAAPPRRSFPIENEPIEIPVKKGKTIQLGKTKAYQPGFYNHFISPPPKATIRAKTRCSL